MLESQWYKKELENSDSDIKHRSLSEEYSFFEAVKDGNIEFVQKNCQEEAFSNPEGMGILSKNSLTNLKYHFVITVALVTRYCIDGGMETEQAYRLSDFYILHMDSCTSIKEISQLHDVMALDFTGKMRLLQKNAALSKPIAQCIDYIYAHISSRITANDDEDVGVANAVSDAVEETFPRTVHHGKGFKPAHQDTVGDNQTDIDAELHTDIIGKGLKHEAYDSDQSGHDNQLHDDADAHGDGLA